MRKLADAHRTARFLRRSARITPRPTTAVIAAKAQRHGIQLSPTELVNIAQLVDQKCNGDWHKMQRKFQEKLWKDVKNDAEKAMLLKYSWKTDQGSIAKNMLLALEFSVVALFSHVGTIVAGQAELHVMGTTFVAVVASMGGATFNEMMIGNTRGGVFWMKDLRFLYVSIGVSLATFYGWPRYETWAVSEEMRAVHRAAGVEDENSISRELFFKALEKDHDLECRIRSAIAPAMGYRREDLARADGPSLMFDWLDQHETGMLDFDDLQSLAMMQVQNSPFFYSVNSILTGTAGISGAQGGISFGMHPVVCVCLGVSLCLGSVMRDLMCRREVSMGSSSFALACFISSSTYTGLRSLVVKGYHIPLALRIILSVGAACCQRAYCWFYLEPGTHALAPMGCSRARME